MPHNRPSLISSFFNLNKFLYLTSCYNSSNIIYQAFLGAQSYFKHFPNNSGAGCITHFTDEKTEAQRNKVSYFKVNICSNWQKEILRNQRLHTFVPPLNCRLMTMPFHFFNVFLFPFCIMLLTF